MAANPASALIACPSCGFEAADDFTFCPKCATVLEAPRTTPDERKVVTTLFCDLVGFTVLSEVADPEEVDALLRTYFARAAAVIESRGGTVEKFIGDAVVGVFGVPTVHEDDAARAVRSGLEIIKAIADLTRPDGSPLQARVGINTGEAVVRLAVAPGSGEGFLTGDAVNTAARLQAAAPPMGVVVGALTHKLTGDACLYEALPPLSLKGKSERVAAWLARERCEQSGTPRPTNAAATVGRERELAACMAAASRLCEGQGGLLLVTGEAGIGKSRLVADLHAKAQGQDCAWLEGHTLSFGHSISYWPFVEIIQQDAGIGSDDPEPARWAKLAGRLTSLFGEEADEVLPYLASLMSLTVPEELAYKVQHLDSEAMGRQVYRATRLYFARLANQRPQVVVFEDVHWLDGSSMALLEHLLPLANKQPLLFCCVSRPEADSALTHLQELAHGQYAERLTEIALHPLSPDESTSLVKSLAPVEELPAQLRQMILTKAGGNPFFVEEIVRSLIDFGGLVRSDATGRYRVTAKASHLAIPDTLQGVIMARVDRLDEELKQVLRLAAVIGRTFFFRVLAAVAEAEQQLDQDLAALQGRELVLERARDPELEYIFKHALVQEATYESILLQRRRELHRDVAVAIESLFASRREDFYGLLAYHYTKAEDWEKAQEYLFKAGDQAGTIAADAEALEHHEQAIDAYGRAYGEDWDPFQRAVLEHKIGEALYRAGDHERAREHLYRALSILGHPFPSTRRGVRIAIAGQVLRQLVHRVLPWRRDRKPDPEGARVGEERLWIYNCLHWMETGEDQLCLVLAGVYGLNLAETVPAMNWAASGWRLSIGYICDMIPLRRLSRFYHRIGAELAEEFVGDPYVWGLVYLLMGTHLYWATGQWEDAAADLMRGSEVILEVGRVRDWGGTMVVGTDALFDLGRIDEALERCRATIKYGQETGDRVVEGWGHIRAGHILQVKGAAEEADHHSRRAIDLLTAAQQPASVATAVGWLACSLLQQGRSEEAAAMLEEFREPIHTYGIRGYFLRSFRTAEAELALARLEASGRDATSDERGKAKAACKALSKLAKADVSALVPAQRAYGSHHWLCGRPGRAAKWWRRSIQTAERFGARYEGALTELELGRRLRDPSALERAEVAFEAMGAKHDLARTRELLRQARILTLS